MFFYCTRPEHMAVWTLSSRKQPSQLADSEISLLPVEGGTFQAVTKGSLFLAQSGNQLRHCTTILWFYRNKLLWWPLFNFLVLVPVWMFLCPLCYVAKCYRGPVSLLFSRLHFSCSSQTKVKDLQRYNLGRWYSTAVYTCRFPLFSDI